MQMPIEEFLDYSKLLYKHRRDRKDAEDNMMEDRAQAQKKPDGKTIGQVHPGQFN
jgi:hypothetical protein